VKILTERKKSFFMAGAFKSSGHGRRLSTRPSRILCGRQCRGRRPWTSRLSGRHALALSVCRSASLPLEVVLIGA